MDFIKRIYKSFIAGPVYVILFGLIFYGIGAGLTYRQRNYEQQGIQVQGEVISLSEGCDDDGCTYSPIVRFKTEDGQSITFESSYASSQPAYHVGEQIQVNYLPEDPAKAAIHGEGQTFRIIFMIVGGIVVAIGLVMFSSTLKGSYSLDP
jgi:hypothetical protein